MKNSKTKLYVCDARSEDASVYEKQQKKIKEFDQIFCFEMKVATGCFQIHQYFP